MLNPPNVLILIPNKTARGGITNYYYTLKKHFGKNIVFLQRGAKNYPFRSNFMVETTRLVYDYFSFVNSLLLYKIQIVQTTTSFSRNSIQRDAIFILLAKLFKKKVIVFYRGWDAPYAESVYRSVLFKKVFLKVDAAIVLSKYQRSKLLEWGFVKQIYTETTLIDNDLIKNINPLVISNKFAKPGINPTTKLLFLARIERSKGLFELLEAVKTISEKHLVELTIAGDGKSEDELKTMISDYKLTNVNFIGFVEKKAKIKAYMDADVYILPSYSEGMPNSILEAMGFGLPILTTPVGGLVDFFEDGVNGFFIKIKSSESIVEKCCALIESEDLRHRIALTNHDFAINHFLASDVAKRNENIFRDVLSINTQ